MKKVLICTLIAVAFIGLNGVISVNAQTENGDGFRFPLAEKIAERFNLNLEEVQKFFEETRQEARQEMQTRFAERDGCELTEEQRQSLSAEREELMAKYGDMKNLSREEMQNRMQEMRSEMQAWAEENGIDSKCAGGGFGKGFRPGFPDK
jgi:cobalamin biosynthesis Mg chelatase CobN